MFVTILLFIVGLVLLIKGGDWFVEGASSIAKRFHIPEIIIGATIVSIGTTLPEVMVSATSAVGGHGELAYGNAIGSIICNTALISALTIAIKPANVDRKTFVLPVVFFYVAAIIYVVLSYTTGYFSRWIGIILLLIFVAYIILSVLLAKKEIKNNKTVSAELEKNKENIEKTQEKESKKVNNPKLDLVKDIVFLVIGAACIAFGAKLLVDNGIEIARVLGVPESVIGLTFVALGTSLPELVTAITSLAKGHGALSLGNIIGANLFNLVLVSGVSITLAPFTIPMSSTFMGMNTALVIDLPVMMLVMTLLTIPTLIRNKVSRWQGIVLLILYAGFCTMQFVI